MQTGKSFVRRFAIFKFLFTALLGALVFTETGWTAEKFAELDTNRIAQIEAMLPEKPAGFGRPCADRAFWTSPATLAAVGNSVKTAEKLLAETFPAWNDDLYLEYSRIGRRPPGEKMMDDRSAWLYPLVLAECLENQGRFLPLINQVLHAYASDPTWTWPAHDGKLQNFHRLSYSVDLRSSAFSADLAEALYLLGDRLDPAVRREVAAAMEERVFAPIRKTLATGNGNDWIGKRSRPVQNNWNAVCLAGVVGAARTFLPDRRDRAVFVAAAEHYSIYFLNEYNPDGYCTEGPGYWAYGFGNYVLLREIVKDATAGRVELFSNSKIRAIAAYGFRVQLTDHLVPPFADCHFGAKAEVSLVGYCNRVFKFGLDGYQNSPPFGRGRLASVFMTETPAETPVNPSQENATALHSFFENAGVLISRPSPGTACCLSIAIKAGGNGSHSHNDVGSFIIALDGQLVAGDPGGPRAYNNKVFGPERYTYKLLNSYGHPVPVVAGQLQKEATKANPRVLETHFTAAEDEMKMDLAPAYEVPELQKLVRTMRYSRAGAGSIVIEDDVAFTKPMPFECALETYGTIKDVDAHTFEFTLGGRKIRAEVEASGDFAVTRESIQELDAPAFTRLAFKLNQPVANATVKITFHGAQ